MKNNKSFLEKSAENYNKFIIFLMIFGFFIYVGSCAGCYHKSEEEIKINKRINQTSKIVGNKWDKWIEKNIDTLSNKK